MFHFSNITFGEHGAIGGVMRSVLMGSIAVGAAVLLIDFGAVLGGRSHAAASVAQAATPPLATAFARRPAISGVSISRDGKHVAAVVSQDGETRIVAVWQSDNLRAAPYLIGTDPRSEIVGVQFIKNDRLFVTTQQKTDFSLGGTAERSFRRRTQVLDLEGNLVRTNLSFDGLTREQQAYVGVGSVVSILSSDPQSILVADPMRGDVYKLNLYTGRAERVQRGSSRFGLGLLDLDGTVRSRSEIDFDSGTLYEGVWLRDAQGEWAEHFRNYARDRKPVSVAGYSNDPNMVYISKLPDGGDHEAIYEYNIATKQFGEIAFAHPVFDAGDLIRSSAGEDEGEVIGFSYAGERNRTVWLDERLSQLVDTASRALNVREESIVWSDISTGEAKRFGVILGANIDVVSTNEARDRAVLRYSGSDTPPEYYLYMNGRMSLLGRAYPELANAKLGNMSFIQYKARDGMDIPAFLVKPDPEVYGPGPYPALVVPHGGPWARDNSDWDVTGWTQYFATRGYAVIQPQFRGSMGWGQKLWRAGDRQWGLTMQDDLDDAVAHMVAEGVTSPGRVAIHGYSYGGYAAMIASTRTSPVFRCAIAGAGPATIDLFKKGTYQSRYLREFQHPTAEGIDPLSQVSNVSIPVYLYTGDRDTNVIPSESRSFATAMERAGKHVKLDILPEMEHSLSTWTPANTAQILTSVEGFLNEQCGLPGAPKI